ncbi:MAG TPA: hypothetical protein VFG37_10275 [Planctomycetota bacterium]|nr:hypothetical protein [Planctomycetota bacterium]
MRRWRWLAGAVVGIAAIVAARACWPELPDPLPHAARSHAGRALDGAADGVESTDGSGDDARLEADRLPEAAAPVPAGSTRYRVKFVKADGQLLTTVRVGVRPEGATESRTITPTSRGAAVLDLDDGCRAVDFSARGYVDVHRAIDARDRERGDLGAIVLTPAAALDVRIVGAPRRATPWLRISSWAKAEVHDHSSDSFGCGDTKVATADGTARATFALPSDTEVWLVFNGSGVAVRSTPPPLAAGVTAWTVDLASFARIRGHVVGVPPSFARGDVVWLQRFVAESDGLFPGMDARAELDDEARFEFAAVPDGPFGLHLNVAGLHEAGGERRDSWRTVAAGSRLDLELEPDRELLGLAIGPFGGERTSKIGNSLRFDDPARSSAFVRAADDPRFSRGLAAADALREASQLFVDPDTERARILDVARLPPPRDGIVTIDLDQFPRLSGRLTVSWNWLASRDWKLYLAASGRPLFGPSSEPAAKRERGLFEETFADLAPGSYDVWGIYDASVNRRLASGVEVAPDEERRIDVTLPSPVRRAGRITNWNEVEPALRPREIVLESAKTAQIKNGRFDTEVAPPIGRTARFDDARCNRIDVTAPVETDADGDLAVRFPVEEVELLELTTQTSPGERAMAEWIGVDPPETIGLFTWYPRASAEADGRIAFVHRRGVPLHGWIDGIADGGEKRVLGWFSSDVPAGTFVPAGRSVEVSTGCDGTTATLFLVARPLGGWTPPRLPLCKVIYGLPRRIWIPDGAEFVDVEFPGRARRRVECATLGERWVIDSE